VLRIHGYKRRAKIGHAQNAQAQTAEPTDTDLDNKHPANSNAGLRISNMVEPPWSSLFLKAPRKTVKDTNSEMELLSRSKTQSIENQ
tara:strand:- start:671 stop:931 length:261 start_codon:yes stop_codon:yes gene_type:complete